MQFVVRARSTENQSARSIEKQLDMAFFSLLPKQDL